ncbi:hypothetical protein PHYNN_64 [Pantoea phage Phynn]|nr:hypothetical protein PHYNN_64 [Pantoea phage Phynn]
MFKKTPRSVDAIVADFDKTLNELQVRQQHDLEQVQKVQDEEAELLRKHAEKMKELQARRESHTESHARAVRVHGKISDLLK